MIPIIDSRVRRCREEMSMTERSICQKPVLRGLRAPRAANLGSVVLLAGLIDALGDTDFDGIVHRYRKT